MKKFIFLSFALFFILAFNLYAESDDKWNQLLYDSVRFGEDGNTKVVDLEQIKLSLAKGANPNWINIQKGNSILSEYVTIISFSENPETDKKGLKAIEMLFEHGAKVQSYDRIILFYPIVSGKYDIVKLLLKKGASAIFWPKHEIGDGYNFDPIDEAAAEGHGKIMELLVSYGAKRLSEKDAIQMRFIVVASSGTIDELEN